MDSKKEKLIAYWNSFAQNWAKNPEAFFNDDQNPFRAIPGIAFDPMGLPEPYLGDPYNCSAVILNYNPGQVMPEYQRHKTGKFITEAKAAEDYYQFAKNFPYLGRYKNNKGGDFWRKRSKWITRVADCSTESKQAQHSKRPFAMEICPWHSNKFSLSEKQVISLAPYLKEHVLDLAEEVALSSSLPFILSVGINFTSLFTDLKFKKIIEVGPENYRKLGIRYPMNGSRPVFRYYSVWQSPTGGLYLNTNAPGSNGCPKAEFSTVEAAIIKHISALIKTRPEIIERLPEPSPDVEITPAPTFTKPTTSTNNQPMRNLDAIQEIKKAVEEEIRNRRWPLVVYPLKHGVESVLYVHKRDILNPDALAPDSCQLVKGGRNAHPYDRGFFSDLESRKKYAVEKTIEFGLKKWPLKVV